MPEAFRDPGPKEEFAPIPWDKPGMLVGIDGSDESVRALRTAAEMAPRLDLPVHVIVVWDYPTFLYGDQYHPQIEAHPDADADGILRDVVEQVFGATTPEWLTSGADRGRAARTLVARSREAEILVVGSRGHGGFAGLLLGSVSTACVAHAHCAVLIVR